MAGSAFADGEEIYNTKCAACHASGVANAPKLGDKEAWAPRIESGNEAMMATIMSGKGAMPPKGACGDCSDEDLQAALDYMLTQVQ
jgi:cytochrome c5